MGVRVQVAIELRAHVLAKLDRIAEATGNDCGQVINGPIEPFLEAEGAEILDDADGFAELEAGKGVDARIMIAEARVMMANASDRERGSP